MGKNERHVPQGFTGAASSGFNVMVLAAASQIRAFSAAGGGDLADGMVLHALELDEPLPQDLRQSVDLMIVEVDPANSHSMDRFAKVRAGYPDVPVVAAVHDTSVAMTRMLVRQGVDDVVSLPLSTEEVMAIILDTSARRAGRSRQRAGLAPMISVARASGGCGATSIATQLAADLLERNRASIKAGGAARGVCLVDLDLQLGNVANYLGVTPRGSINDLLEAGDRLDQDLIASVLATDAHGIHILPAPEQILPLDAVDTDQLLRIVRMLRERFDYVVLDLPSYWTNWTLSTALDADVILLVVELTIASLRQARRRLDLFASVGIPRDHIGITVNRVEKRLFKAIDVSDVADTLRHEVAGAIRLDGPLVGSAQDQGQLASDIQRKCKFAQDVHALADTLLAGRLGRSL